MNEYVKENEEIEIPILEINDETGKNQCIKLQEIKNTRDDFQVKETLDAIKIACRNGDNIMPLIIKAAKSYATLGEIVNSMKDEFGEWQETSVF